MIPPMSHRYDMGMAVIQDGKTNLYNSDRPYDHIREAESFDTLMKNYLSSTEGQRFIEYLHSRGKELVEIKGFGAGDLGEHTVAATLKNNLEGIIVSNYQGHSFSERVQQMADQYGINTEAMTEYVIAHELSHAAGYKSEAETEGFVKDYFTTQAFQHQGEDRQKYVQLAKIAEQRQYEAEKEGK